MQGKKCFIGLKVIGILRESGHLTELMAVFENEEAERLLNYFISYKEIVKKNENHPSKQGNDEIKIAVLPTPQELSIK
ncbi:MAG: hypothetical protein ABSD92_09835 [Candidatus Bathyarchaeia archaeon]|jgi:hypothetical protein